MDRETLQVVRNIVEARMLDFDKAARNTGSVAYEARSNEDHVFLAILDEMIEDREPVVEEYMVEDELVRTPMLRHQWKEQPGWGWSYCTVCGIVSAEPKK